MRRVRLEYLCRGLFDDQRLSATPLKERREAWLHLQAQVICADAAPATAMLKPPP